jgi:hypothetical protein
MSHRHVAKVAMPMVSVFRCQEDTEDRAQKTDDRKLRVDCFLTSVCAISAAIHGKDLTPETFIFGSTTAL